jgi:hypothetical protein
MNIKLAQGKNERSSSWHEEAKEQYARPDDDGA